MTRIQFNVPDDKLEELDEMRKELGLSTRKDLFNNAMTLLEWTMNQKKKGHKVVALNEMDDSYRELVMPALENVEVETPPAEPA